MFNKYFQTMLFFQDLGAESSAKNPNRNDITEENKEKIEQVNSSIQIIKHLQKLNRSKKKPESIQNSLKIPDIQKQVTNLKKILNLEVSDQTIIDFINLQSTGNISSLLDLLSSEKKGEDFATVFATVFPNLKYDEHKNTKPVFEALAKIGYTEGGNFDSTSSLKEFSKSAEVTSSKPSLLEQGRNLKNKAEGSINSVKSKLAEAKNLASNPTVQSAAQFTGLGDALKMITKK
jgi:hypothetical protein